MTTTLKQYENGKKYVYLEAYIKWERTVLEVGICDILGGLYMNPYKKMTYSYKNKKNALATYYRYVREAKAEIAERERV